MGVLRFSVGIRFGLLIVGMLLLSACGGGNDADPPAPSTYSVGGTVTGLNGSLTLANNGGDARTVNANGDFTFATALAGGANYAVTITSQPANQTCTVTAGGGTIGAANVTAVSVNCVNNTFSVGGTVTGLVGSVTLTNNGGDFLDVNADGAFTFTTGLANGASYDVAVMSEPDNQDCALTRSAGTIAATNVSNVTVTCETIRIVASIGPAGGTVTGPGGAQVVIPAGALTQATDIGVARPSSGWPLPLPADETLAGSIYEFTPHNLEFKKPVVIRLPVPPGAGNLGMLIATFGEDWHHQDVLQDSNFIELERSTFSWYAGYNLNACVYTGPPRVGACTSLHAHGHSWATATPNDAIVMTSGGSIGAAPSNTYSVTGSAGTWAVDLDRVQTVHVSMAYGVEGVCSNGHLQLKHMASGFPPQIVRDVPAPLTPSGRGIATMDISRVEFIERQSAFFVRYACTRSSGNESGGGDWITLDFGHGPTSGFTLGGTVTGLNVAGLELQLGSREVVNVLAGATNFRFSAPLMDGTRYEVRIRSQPQGARCTLDEAIGTINSEDMTKVAVICTPVGPAPPVYTVIANSSQLSTTTLFGRQAGDGSLTLLATKNSGRTPQSVAITPFGPFIYVANMGDGFISPFSIDRATNTLVDIPLSALSTPNPTALAIDPLEGRFLWVTSNSNIVSSFSINTSTGKLDALGTIPTGRISTAIAGHPNGNFVYALSAGDSSIYRYQVDRVTGTLTSLGSLSNVVASGTDLAIAPSGNFGYALGAFGSIARLSVNGGTGQLGILGFTAVNSSSSCEALTIHPNGSFLFTTCTNVLGAFVTAFSIDPVTGALTAGVNTPIGASSPATLAIERGGLVMHVAHQLSNTVHTFSVDPSTGGLTLTGSAATGNGPTAIASVP
jgi:6-phosphogluconolactonase (cycloisomerase 2 family)